MRRLIEKNFTLALMLGIAGGLFAPGLDRLAAYVPILIIAVVMFFSCSKVSLAELRGFDRRAALAFYPLRFVLLPALLYWGAQEVWPEYALGVLLIALMPVGVASTAMAGMTGGNPSLSLAATVVTNALTPLMVPLMLLALSGQEVTLDASRLFTTLGLSVFVPSGLYFLLARRIASVRAVVVREAQATTTVLLSLMAACVIALQREHILEHPEAVAGALAATCALFALLYGAGWLYGWREGVRQRRTYSICSGTNNIALSAGIAALYFPAPVVVFTVMGEIAWIFAVAAFKRGCRFRQVEPQPQAG